jgi:RNA polymerase sigma-70 factor (ECF subfamily)
MIGFLAQESIGVLLAELPDDQRDAVTAHVIEERDYGELAATLQISEAAVRQRVARGLSALRRNHGGRR